MAWYCILTVLNITVTCNIYTFHIFSYSALIIIIITNRVRSVKQQKDPSLLDFLLSLLLVLLLLLLLQVCVCLYYVLIYILCLYAYCLCDKF